MKKIIVLVVVLLALGMGCSNNFYAIQRSFNPSDLATISPPNLAYGKELSKNWWEGSYNDRPVIIHAIVSSSYVNVTFQFVDKE